MKKILTRFLIVSFWICLIFCALYLPKWEMAKYEKNTLNIFVWGDILEPTIVRDFEKKTGIKLNMSYYSSNEELIVKLKATRGEGYDLVIPSDYAAQILIKEGLLKSLDKKLFAYWDQLKPELLHKEYDPTNDYCIPFEWELFGFGIDKEYFERFPMYASCNISWNMLFHPGPYKVVMDNDPIEAIEFASFYLYGPQKSISQPQAEKVKRLLIQQKPWVVSYANFRGDYFIATKNAALSLASSSYIFRSKKQFNFIGFVVPEEGTFLTIENFCIPRASQKEALVFEFINYLCSPESVAAHFDTYGQFPSVMHPLEIFHQDPEIERLLFSTKEDFTKYYFIKNVLPEDKTRDLWVEIKS